MLNNILPFFSIILGKRIKTMKILKKSTVLALSVGVILAFNSCSPGYGCEMSDNATVKTNRKGELPTKGRSSSLFPKEMNKKMGKKKN